MSPECDLDRSLRLFSFLFSMFKNTRTINRAVISGVEWIHNARTVFSNSVYFFLIRREQRPEFSKSNNVSLSLSLSDRSQARCTWKNIIPVTVSASSVHRLSVDVLLFGT